MIKRINGKEAFKKRGMTAVIYGKNGSGKTFLVNTLPDGEETVYIGFEGGIEPILGKDIDILEIESPSNVTDLSNFSDLMKCIKERKVFQGIDFSKIKNLVVDNISEMRKFIQVGLRISRNKKFLSQLEYGNTAELFKRYLRVFRDLSNHGIYVTLISHDRIRDHIDENGIALTQIVPDVGETIVNEAMGMFDVVGRVEVENVKGKNKSKRSIRIAGDSMCLTKIRCTGYVEKYGQTVPQDLGLLYRQMFTLIKERIEKTKE